MRIVDQVPAALRLYGQKYPYDRMFEAIARGQIVELDPDDYGTKPGNTRNAVTEYAARHHLPWNVYQRQNKIYVTNGKKQR